MNSDEMVVERLDLLTRQVAVITDSARALRELRDDLSPRINETVKHLITQLAEIEADCRREDLVLLLKNVVRNVRNLNWSMEQVKSLIDFLRTVEPLMKSAVPQAIMALDQLEQRGVLQVGLRALEVLRKIAETYTPEDIEEVGKVLVHFIGVTKKLSDPNALALLDRMAEIPARIDLSNARPAGPFRMMFALRNSEVKQGLGVVLEMTKGLAALKDGAPMETEVLPVVESSEQPTLREESKG
jgi:uncharacterized protein YjgD (DUF1641 family)